MNGLHVKKSTGRCRWGAFIPSLERDVKYCPDYISGTDTRQESSEEKRYFPGFPYLFADDKESCHF